ncbi:hypothetical protein SDC9_158524 [bioreactor metagenome]|uniref:Uncharacterized protein n=1 Tax=bioreactor metagenome TaxID=1076179 RepID=A0A645FFS9_9ZZZZ
MGVGKVKRLPHLALVRLAVAHHAEHAVVPSVDFVAQRRARRAGRALSQRSGGQVHAGSELAVRVAGKPRVRVVQGVCLLHGIEAHQTVGGVGHRACVALGQHQPVPILPPGIFRIELHDLAVQHRHQLRQIHGPAHMAKAKRVYHLQRLQADLRRQNVQCFRCFFIH